MVLRLYLDMMSQPCRAVTMFLRFNGIACEEVLIPLRKGQHLTPAFAQINPFQKVPVLDHDGFKITESAAMLTYLCRVFPVKDHWYPKNDYRKLATIESYLAWQHLNIRIYGGQYFRHKIMAYAGQAPLDEAKVASFAKGLETALQQIETIWLKDRPFIATDDLSIADLMAVTELEQPIIAGYDVTKGRPRTEAYMNLVRSRLQPHYDDVHQVAKTMREKMSASGTQTKAKL